MIERRALAALLAAAALAGAGCGGDAEESPPPGPGATAPAPPTEPATNATRGDQPVSRRLDEKPVIAPPSGQPPGRLVKQDVVRGKGRRARAGDTIAVQYVGVAWSTGEEFDASWDRGEPFEFPLGVGDVIPGWDRGIVGMREGGRRKLVIPPDLGYGPAGAGADIGPNETLVFVVDLLEVR